MSDTRAAALPRAIAPDRDRELLGQVGGPVALTVGFTALGAYLGRDLSGSTGLLLFIGAFGCIIGLNVAAARGREQLAIGLRFGLVPLAVPSGSRRPLPAILTSVTPPARPTAQSIG